MESPTEILTAEEIVKLAEEITNKIHHAMLVCNLRDHNRYEHLLGHILVLSLIAADSVRYTQEDVKKQVSRLLRKYDTKFTRLLKGKPSQEECIKAVLSTDQSTILDNIIKELKNSNHEKTT